MRVLVLSRKQNQEIMIGDDIRVSVVRIQGNSIRLGIQAPDSVRILRSELAAWHDLSFGDEPEREKTCLMPPSR